MNDKIFLDSNILVYAYDKHEKDKQMKAQSILENAFRTENCIISVQVLGEFFNVVTRKIKIPMKASEAHNIIKTMKILQTEDIDLLSVNRAIEVHIKHQLSYWDSLIIATAEKSNCKKIYSEDLNHGQLINGVLIENPF